MKKILWPLVYLQIFHRIYLLESVYTSVHKNKEIVSIMDITALGRGKMYVDSAYML